MSLLPVTLACGDYDRTADLRDGQVRIEGVDLNYLTLPAEETFFRMLGGSEFEAAEMSLSSYVLTQFEADQRFVAIPVFPSRSFRHSCVWVRADSPYTEPRDLRGRQIGIPEYQMTAAVWLRGIFADRHDLPFDSPVYRTGGLLQPGRREKLPLSLPPGIDVQPIGSGDSLTELLLDGTIDALYTARSPETSPRAAGRLRPLFPDAAAAEREYARQTGIFPIMHTVVLRRDVYQRNRWLAQSLVKAFQAAKANAYRRLEDTTALTTTLPWQLAARDEARRLLGNDFWPYGTGANNTALRTFLRYSHEQGLAGRLLEPRELFAPESIAAHLI